MVRGRRLWLDAGALAAVAFAVVLITARNAPEASSHQLINVSYDPTREVYRALNSAFIAAYEKQTGRHLVILQSHGGSSKQARRIIRGEQPADVVTLGLPSDVGSLQLHGLVAAGWAERLPNHARPYTSTIVFVVRQGNPHNIQDWPDLVAPGVEIVTPDPASSGNGKLVALAAWAAVVTRGGTDASALSYLQMLYQHVSRLDEGARGAAIGFALQDIGDVHLTWENEARREVAASGGRLQVITPPVSILAEPAVAWVDRAMTSDEKLADAKGYLQFLFSDTAQAIIAQFGYRPATPEIADEAGITFPPLTLIPVTAIARDWDDANQKFFAEGGIMDGVLGKPGR